MILQTTSLDRIWPKVNRFCSDFREEYIFGCSGGQIAFFWWNISLYSLQVDPKTDLSLSLTCEIDLSGGKKRYLTPKIWFLVFLGSNAHLIKRGTYFFHFWMYSVLNLNSPVLKKNGPFRLKRGYLTPKTLKSCFWGLKPIFSLVTPTSFFLNRFQMWFDTSFEEKNIPFQWKNVYLTPRTP